MFRIDLASLEPGVHPLTREVEADALAPPTHRDPAGKRDPEEETPGEKGAGEKGAGEKASDEAAAATADEVTFGPVQVDAVIDLQPERVLVTFQARTMATLICDRTLRRFEQPLEGSYAVLFADPGRGTPAESDEHDELRALPPGARYLDLTEAVRDTLLLAVPQRTVAPGAEDEELDTVFGAREDDAETPVDPRWAKLRELRSSQNGS